jgi:NitT/TauT family transport system substrate-binding protein
MNRKEKSLLAVLMMCIMVIFTFSGCGGNNGSPSESTSDASYPSVSAEDSEQDVSEDAEDAVIETPNDVIIRIGTLKGPNGMGMAELMDANKEGASANTYDFTLTDAPDKLSPLLVSGEIDIAALPVNMASILYNKMDKGISIMNVNTLGVIYVLTNGVEIASVADLKGQTIYATGQGASPEYVLNHILSQNGIDPEKDVVIDYKSEHAELAALITAGQAPIAVLPEPFVTTVTMQNPDIKIALDLTKEWETVANGAEQTVGCMVVRNEFLEEHKDAVDVFLEEFKKSAEFANSNVDEAAELMAQFEIIPKAEVAKQAIPRCNIVFMDGPEMQSAVETYLKVLFEANPQSVGGALPDEAFYYRK